MRKLTTCGLLVACALTWSLVSTSKVAAAPPTGPCAADAAKLCKDVQPGRGRIAHCLKQHESDLSDACKKHLAEVKKENRDRGQKIVESCRDDTKKLCADVQPGGGRIMACLKEHKADLSAGCKTALGL